MWREYRESAGFAVAALIGCAAAGVYFVATLPSAPPGGRVGLRGARFTWAEWRTQDFYDMAATLDRRDPARVVRRVLEANREGRFDVALAYGTDARQRRFTPTSMARAYEENNPELLRWTDLTLDETLLAADRAVVRLRLEWDESPPKLGRAQLRRDADGSWRLDILALTDPPEPVRRERRSQYAARLALPFERFIDQPPDRATPTSVVQQALLYSRNAGGEEIRDMLISHRNDPRTFALDGWLETRHPWWLELFHPGLAGADDSLVLGETRDGARAEVSAVAIRGNVARRFTFRCENAGGESRASPPKWRVVAIEP